MFLTEHEIQTAIAASGITDARQIYSGDFYDPTKVRCAVFLGTRDGEPVALKAWSDPRESEEPLHLQRFLDAIGAEHAVFTAPRLIAHERWSATAGWMLMSVIDTQTPVYAEPPDAATKNQFLKLWHAYRQVFPTPPGHVPSSTKIWGFMYSRLLRWLSMAREAGNLPQAYLNRCHELVARALGPVDEMRIAWIHGHFMRSQLFRQPDGRIALTDFAHCKWMPEVWEVSMIIWQFLMDNGLKLTPAEASEHVREWLEVTKAYGVNQEHLRATLLDRYIGAVCADIGSRKWKPQEQAQLLAVWDALLKELN